MKKNNSNTIKRQKFFGIGDIWPYIKQHSWVVFVMLVFGIMLRVVDVIIPLFQKYALDHFVKNSTLKGFAPYIILYIAVIALSGFAGFSLTKFSFKTEMLVKRDLRDQAFCHLQTLSFSYFSRNSVGYIHSRLMSDVTNIAFFVAMHGPYTIIDFIYVLGAIIVMLTINVKLTLFVISVIPLLAIIFFAFQKGMMKVNRKVRESNSQITSDFNESVSGGKTIKTLGVEDEMIETFRKDTLLMKRRSVKYARLSGLFRGIMDFGASFCIAIVLWKGGILAENEVGTFSLFMSYAQGMIEPIRWVMENIAGFITTRVNIERYTGLMKTKSDVSDSPEVIEKYGDSYNPKRENWEDIKGDIEFSHVTFKYPDGDEIVLDDFNLKIPFGSNVAIVGETGAGKSTLVNLLCRFYEPTKGKVLIDGKDARERSQLWLHSKLGYVLQTPHLFSGTIKDNLIYGKRDATDEEIYRALEMVDAREMVERLEKGIYSPVGEGGDLLSAGEKQLISFARAILADPKLIILDEATASVDTLTEKKIQGALKNVTANRTSVVIAHRISTIKDADIILAVKKGKIVEKGTHAELMKMGGYYRRLYLQQYESEATSALLKESKSEPISPLSAY